MKTIVNILQAQNAEKETIHKHIVYNTEITDRTEIIFEEVKFYKNCIQSKK